MIDAPEVLAGEIAADDAPAALVGEAVQAGPLPTTLPAAYYALPVVPDWGTGLNDRRRKYVEAYLSNGFNSVAACREAGYNEKRGTLLRRDPRIIKAIEGAMRESGIARQRVLAELGALAFSSLSDIVDWKNGKLTVRDASELTDEQRRSVTRIECDETGAITKLATDLRGPALTLLAKALRVVGPEMAIGIAGTNLQIILSKDDQAVL